jgi:hypothetical protein
MSKSTYIHPLNADGRSGAEATANGKGQSGWMDTGQRTTGSNYPAVKGVERKAKGQDAVEVFKQGVAGDQLSTTEMKLFKPSPRRRNILGLQWRRLAHQHDIASLTRNTSPCRTGSQDRPLGTGIIPFADSLTTPHLTASFSHHLHLLETRSWRHNTHLERE